MGAAILSMLVGVLWVAHNQLRQDLWRAGHAGVLLVLSLVALRYVDEATLSKRMKWLVRHSIPAAAILLPIAFFLSVASPDATKPNALIYLAYVGAISLAVGLLVLGVGLVRGPRTSREGKPLAKYRWSEEHKTLQILSKHLDVAGPTNDRRHPSMVVPWARLKYPTK